MRGGEVPLLQFYVGVPKKRGQVGACPLPRTRMKPFIFHTTHPASSLVQRQISCILNYKYSPF